MLDEKTSNPVELPLPPTEGAAPTEGGSSPKKRNKLRFRVSTTRFPTGGKAVVYEVAVDREREVAEVHQLRCKTKLEVPLGQWLRLAFDKWGEV